MAGSKLVLATCILLVAAAITGLIGYVLKPNKNDAISSKGSALQLVAMVLGMLAFFTGMGAFAVLSTSGGVTR